MKKFIITLLLGTILLSNTYSKPHFEFNLYKIHNYKISQCPESIIKPSEFEKISNILSIDTLRTTNLMVINKISPINNGTFDYLQLINNELKKNNSLNDTTHYDVFGEIIIGNYYFITKTFLIFNTHLINWGEFKYEFNLNNYSKILNKASNDIVDKIILSKDRNKDLDSGTIKFYRFLIPMLCEEYHTEIKKASVQDYSPKINYKDYVDIFIDKLHTHDLNGNLSEAISRIYNHYQQPLKPKDIYTHLSRKEKKYNKELEKYKNNFKKYPVTLQFLITYHRYFQFKNNNIISDTLNKEAYTLFHLSDTLTNCKKEIKIWKKHGFNFTDEITKLLYNIQKEGYQYTILNKAKLAENSGQLLTAISYYYYLLKFYKYDSAYYKLMHLTSNISLKEKCKEDKSKEYIHKPITSLKDRESEINAILNKDLKEIANFSGNLNYNIEIKPLGPNRLEITYFPMTIDTLNGAGKYNYALYSYASGEYRLDGDEFTLSVISRNIKEMFKRFSLYIDDSSKTITYFGSADASNYLGKFKIDNNTYSAVQNILICDDRKGNDYIKFKDLIKMESYEKNLALAYLRAYAVKNILEVKYGLKNYLPFSKLNPPKVQNFKGSTGRYTWIKLKIKFLDLPD